VGSVGIISYLTGSVNCQIVQKGLFWAYNTTERRENMIDKTKHIYSISDLLNIISLMYQYLQGRIEFSCDGWPVFKKEHFLEVWPDLVVTFRDRKSALVKNKKKTLLCFFTADCRIYPRFVKVFKEINTYKEFLGVVEPDVTVTQDMDVELQEVIMLANQLFIAALAVNGVRIVLNTRSGNKDTLSCFKYIPRGVVCASGFLGCEKSKNYWEAATYTDKVLGLMPERLIIYGKQDQLIDEQLDAIGIAYRYYEDFHTLSKRRAS
jgi:hypothetical protein